MEIKHLKPSLSFFLLLIACLYACEQDKGYVDITKADYTDAEYEVIARTLNIPQQRANYFVTLPTHMARAGIPGPLVSSAKATLGQVLFYDTKLSANNTVSCASCHKQSLGFSDDVALSKGFNGNLTKRNSLALASVPNFDVSYKQGNNVGSLVRPAAFFWDERAKSIPEQSKMTLQDAIEMGVDLDQLSKRLENIAYYNILFTKAFGTGKVTPNRVTDALEHFINGFISTDTPFDEGLNKQADPMVDFANFTAQENRGKALFNTSCANCHSADFTSVVQSVANNGLDIDYQDNGVGALTNHDRDQGQFKVPFLRNIALTGPYMHDGRFETLEDVLDHYSEGIQEHPNLDKQLRKDGVSDGEALRLNYTTEEKAALLAFLHTLTDYEFIQDEKFSDPFK